MEFSTDTRNHFQKLCIFSLFSAYVFVGFAMVRGVYKCCCCCIVVLILADATIYHSKHRIITTRKMSCVFSIKFVVRGKLAGFYLTMLSKRNKNREKIEKNWTILYIGICYEQQQQHLNRIFSSWISNEWQAAEYKKEWKEWFHTTGNYGSFTIEK